LSSKAKIGYARRASARECGWKWSRKAGFAQERAIAGGHFADDDAERENIGKTIDFVAANLQCHDKIVALLFNNKIRTLKAAL
jgi:hypothetical protein